MTIELKNIKPNYMSEDEVSSSDIYLQDSVIFQKGKKYLVKANSGHGKTSILNFIYGTNSNYDGEICYEPTYENDVFTFRKNKISYVFQDFKLFPELTVLENIQIKNVLTNNKSIDEIEALIDQVQLNHKKNSLVKTLSLGQRQRVAILRAICQPFDFILLDEPFSHLDDKNISIISKIIHQEIKKNDAGLILTSLEKEYHFEYDYVLNL